MGRTELVNHTLQWTWGACIMWNQWAKQFNIGDPAFQDFVHRTHTVVWKYLTGQHGLTGSCSDFECNTAMQARAVFKDLMGDLGKG